MSGEEKMEMLTNLYKTVEISCGLNIKIVGLVESCKIRDIINNCFTTFNYFLYEAD